MRFTSREWMSSGVMSGPARRGGGSQEAADGGEEDRLVEQEGVVAAVGLDLDEADRGAARIERADDRLLSTVGNSQSEVKEATQKRVREPRNALASRPP